MEWLKLKLMTVLIVDKVVEQIKHSGVTGNAKLYIPFEKYLAAFFIEINIYLPCVIEPFHSWIFLKRKKHMAVKRIAYECS